MKHLTTIVIIVAIMVVCSGCQKPANDQKASLKEKTAGLANPLDKCKKGVIDWFGTEATMLGKEKHELNGKNIELCCIEMQDSSPRLLEDKDIKTKKCMKELMGGPFIIWAYNENLDKMMKTSDGYPKGEQVCSRSFDFDTGEQTGDEYCMTIK